jgi:HPt (histidine-containing phosphotransfer) domain-containing protein
MLAKLRSLGGQTLHDQVIDTFLADAPVWVAAAVDAARRGEAADVAKAAHRLISSAGQLGANELSAASAELEQAVQAGGDGLLARVERWKALFDAACRELAERRGRA